MLNKQARFKPLEPIVPFRIREARLSRGISATDFANRMGISKQALSKYELGLSSPSSSVLETISKELNFPISFFSKKLTVPPNRGTTFFRSFKTNSARAKEVMTVKGEWATEIATCLSKDIIFPDVDLPLLPEIDGKRTDELSSEDIESIAIKLRDHWKLGRTPIPNMAFVLESHGIVIATVKSGFPETDACSSFVEGRPFIFLDIQKECAVRTRFNLAHELGHLVLHNSVSQADLEEKVINKKLEQQADCFAAAFLMPQESFSLDIRSTSLQSFLALKAKWKVSIQAMVHRCKELGIFSENQTLYLYKQISAKRWRKNEPYDDEWPCEKPTVLSTAAKMLIDRGDYTKDEFIELFRLPSSDIEELCSLPKGFLSSQNANNTILVDFATHKVIKEG